MRTEVSRWLWIVAIATMVGCALADADPVDIGEGAEPGSDEIGQIQQAAISGTLVTPTPVYTGIYLSGAGSEELRFGMPLAQLQSELTTQAGRGFRLVQLVAAMNSGAVRYSAIWNSGSATQVLRTGLSPTQFDNAYASLWWQGYSLTSFTTYLEAGQLRVSGVFSRQTATEVYSVNRTRSEFQGDFDAQRAVGMRLSHISASNVAGVTRYSGIWKPSTAGQEVRMNQTAAQFASEQSTQAARGHRIVSVAITAIDGVRRYHSVYHQSASAPQLLERLGEPGFRTRNTAQRTAGRRLTSLAANEDSLNLTKMADEVHTAFTRLHNHGILCPAPQTPCITATVGYAVTFASGTTRQRRAMGSRRTAADAPQRASSNTQPVNLASVTKTVTAAAVQEALAENTSADLGTPIQNFLPRAWRGSLGAGVASITMGQLLTHSSGLSVSAPADDRIGFNDLRLRLQQPVTTAEKERCRTATAADGSQSLPEGCYRNQNFALFRIIIPYLAGYVEGTNIEKETADFYLNYVNTRILTPASAGPVSTKPPAIEPTLFYTYPAGNLPGVGFGDTHLVSGSYGLHLSSDQLANFLANRYSASVIGGPAAVEQDSLLLGWQSSTPVRFGVSRAHGGYLYQPNASPRNGNHELHTLAVSMCHDTVLTPSGTCVGGVHAGLLINSRTNGIDAYAAIRNAYENNWMTTY